MSWAEVVVPLLVIWGTCYSNPVGYILGPCDCSIKSDIQCRRLKDLSQLQEMMRAALEAISLAPYADANVRSIRITYSHFNSPIPPDIFKNTEVEFVEFVDTPLGDGLIQSSTGRALIGTESSISTLRISNCEFQINGWTDMSNLENLKTLSLPRNGIEDITNLLFSRPPQQLETLVLYSNGLKSLADRAFRKLDNLKIIDLADNRLQSLTRNMFASPAMHLKTIYLQNNNIAYLSQDIFSSMPKLTEVNLNDNRLTMLGEKTWSRVWSQLTRIYLEGNKWVCTCEIMGWLIKPNIRHSQQVITGRCHSPFLTTNKPIEYVTDIDLTCDLQGELS